MSANQYGAACNDRYEYNADIWYILRMNIGKVMCCHCTYRENPRWGAAVFKGIIEAVGDGVCVICDINCNKRTLIMGKDIDYITFEETGLLNYPSAIRPAPYNGQC